MTQFQIPRSSNIRKKIKQLNKGKLHRIRTNDPNGFIHRNLLANCNKVLSTRIA